MLVWNIFIQQLPYIFLSIIKYIHVLLVLCVPCMLHYITNSTIAQRTRLLHGEKSDEFFSTIAVEDHVMQCSHFQVNEL